jgi:phage tail sheath protein FI
MPEYLPPGLDIEEIERGPRPIEGVPTSTAAFLGETERGSVKPRLVTSYRDYQTWFGDVCGADKFLPYAVNGFFENGGKRVFICRLVSDAATTAQTAFGDFAVRATGPGSWGTRVFAKIEDSTTKDIDGNSIGFRLRLAYWIAEQVPFDPFTPDGGASLPQPTLTEDFDNLVVDETSPDFYGNRVSFIDLERGRVIQGPGSSALGILVRSVGVAPTARPTNGAQQLGGGVDDANPLGVEDYVGAPTGSRTEIQGLAALELDPYRDVALVYAPNVPTNIVLKIVDHCESMRFRFAVIDCPKEQSNPSDLQPRSMTDTSYAAFYYPWIVTSDPITEARKLIPPGGHILGVFARTDAERGVFKSPANEILRGAVDLEYDVNDSMQDDLNLKGVNVIRRFPESEIRVWGASTISSDPQWRYVSVRRHLIFLERSIYEGTRWVVFEPNDDRLWARVVATVQLFLQEHWRLGALVGLTEREAFFIKCDRTTMSEDDILNGRLICEIGISPMRPAEFVIFRIFRHTAVTPR